MARQLDEIELRKQAQLHAQMQAQREAATQNLIMSAGKEIFVALVAKYHSVEDGLSPKNLRDLATLAKEYSPFIAEAYGLVTLEIKDEAANSPKQIAV